MTQEVDVDAYIDEIGSTYWADLARAVSEKNSKLAYETSIALMALENSRDAVKQKLGLK